MKWNLQLVLIFTIVAFACLLGWQSSAQTTNKATWEYKIYTAHGTPIPSPDMNQFNKLGAEGWEFVESQAHPSVNGMTGQQRVDYFFKRMK